MLSKDLERELLRVSRQRAIAWALVVHDIGMVRRWIDLSEFTGSIIISINISVTAVNG